MNEAQILRQAVLYAMSELSITADLLGSEGFFTHAKHINIDVLHKLSKALDESKRVSPILD